VRNCRGRDFRDRGLVTIATDAAGPDRAANFAASPVQHIVGESWLLRSFKFLHRPAGSGLPASVSGKGKSPAEYLPLADKPRLINAECRMRRRGKSRSSPPPRNGNRPKIPRNNPGSAPSRTSWAMPGLGGRDYCRRAPRPLDRGKHAAGDSPKKYGSETSQRHGHLAKGRKTGFRSVVYGARRSRNSCFTPPARHCRDQLETRAKLKRNVFWDKTFPRWSHGAWRRAFLSPRTMRSLAPQSERDRQIAKQMVRVLASDSLKSVAGPSHQGNRSIASTLSDVRRIKPVLTALQAHTEDRP